MVGVGGGRLCAGEERGVLRSIRVELQGSYFIWHGINYSAENEI